MIPTASTSCYQSIVDQRCIAKLIIIAISLLSSTQKFAGHLCKNDALVTLHNVCLQSTLFTIQIDAHPNVHPPTSVLRNQSQEHAQAVKSHVSMVLCIAVRLHADAQCSDMKRCTVQCCADLESAFSCMLSLAASHMSTMDQLCIWGFFIGALRGSFRPCIAYASMMIHIPRYGITQFHNTYRCVSLIFCTNLCIICLCVCVCECICTLQCFVLRQPCVFVCVYFCICTLHCIVFGHPDLRQFPPILCHFLRSPRQRLACPYNPCGIAY